MISLGDPSSRYDLDLYGGGTDPDAAAGTLAEALLDAHGTEEGDLRRAATALSQLLGPYRRRPRPLPAVSELRELLDGVPHAFAALRGALDAAGRPAWSANSTPGSGRPPARRHRPPPRRPRRPARPARFAGFFDVTGRTRPFSMYALEHPLRVRIDLPERGHAEASRILARLVLAQFTAAVTARRDRSLFACLVLDDAAPPSSPPAFDAAAPVPTTSATCTAGSTDPTSATCTAGSTGLPTPPAPPPRRLHRVFRHHQRHLHRRDDRRHLLHAHPDHQICSLFACFRKAHCRGVVDCAASCRLGD